ncbi:DUF3099 domain-containing protein [Streptomyces sp. NPDC093221]|uniref:DUF3099 domain-containing protein n=1 Tax=Streptomyces sp. NPDC093221 TaxID=3366032 RepID=UPI00380A132C
MNARRRHWYFAMMGTCVVLFVMAWSVVRIWSVPAAIAMCLVAMVIPPVAAIVANRKGPEDRWWDEEPLRPEERKPTGRERDDPPPPGATSMEEHRRMTPARSERQSYGSSGDPESDRWWDELDRGGPP